MSEAETRLITALDYADPADALALVTRLEPALTRLKVGNELFTAAGPALVETLQGRGFDVFLDLKYHDIPNTVASACARAAALGVWMLNVHAGGGRRMLEAAREAVPRYGGASGGGTRLIAVTVLTSLAREDLVETGLDAEPDAQVERLATLARDAALDGVVCSPREIGLIRALAPSSFLSVTPGIRPHTLACGGAPSGGPGSGDGDPLTVRPAVTGEIVSHGGHADDQRRTLTPGEAILAGADHLVVGRAVTQAADPLVALEAITAEVDEALHARRATTDEGAG